MLSRVVVALVLVVSTGCGASKAVATAAVKPVYFEPSEVEFLATDLDYLRIGQVAQRLQQDAKLYVCVVGYADTSGDPDVNDQLSVERAELVRTLLMESGVPPQQVVAMGRGEANDGFSEARRVEFTFLYDKPGQTHSADAIMAAATPPPSTARSSGGGGGGDTASAAAAGERKEMMPTGLGDLDAFFGTVQSLLDRLRSSQDKITAAEANFRSAVGAAEGAKLKDSLAALKAQAAGAIKVEMVDGKPSISVDAGAPAEVGQAVEALQGFVDALGQATVELASLPNDAQAVINEAKALPGKVPAMAKDAGLSLGEMTKVLKAVKNNVGLTLSIPVEAAGVGKQAASTFAAIGSSFA